MSRKLAHIEKIEWLKPIEGKDRIVLAGILGWTVIVQKDLYKEGDKVVFCEIDSVFPEKPEFEFLRSKKFRIKTMKMSGVLSQGICFPLSMLPEGNYEIGDDVTELMSITQYEPTMDKEEVDYTKNNLAIKNYPKFLMRMAWFRKLVLPKKQAKGFPSFISKTDESRVQNCPFYLDMDCKWTATEKVDGQSGTFTLQRILCLAWKDNNCLVTKRKLSLVTKLDKLSERIYTVSVSLERRDKKCLHLQTMRI